MATSKTNRRRLQEAPHYFGSYLNMALHNIFMITKYLSEKYGMSDALHLGFNRKKEVEKLAGEKDSDYTLADIYFDLLDKPIKDPVKTERFIEDLIFHFPFLKVIIATEANNVNNKKKKEPYEIIKTYLKDTTFILLNQLRNKYSHYKTNTAIKTARDFPIQAIYEYILKEDLLKRFKDTFKQEDIEHLKMSHLYPVLSKDGNYNELGLSFFICLFLERKEAFRFLNGLQCFPHTDTPKDRAMLWVYAIYNCRLPQPKLESSDILLDMLNELGKCPKPIYTHLCEADQYKINENFFTQTITEGVEESSAKPYRHEQYEKESALEDRFTYFALRYFDDQDIFPSLRFQIALGKFVKESYRKVIYQKEQDRLLMKPIHLFAKLQPFRVLYDKVTFTTLLKDNKLCKVGIIEEKVASKFVSFAKRYKQYQLLQVEQFSPHYNISHGTIGFDLSSGINSAEFPDINTNFNNKIPNGIISIYELKNLFLYDFLHKNSEYFISQYIANFKAFINDLKSNQFQPLSKQPDFEKNKPLPFVKDNPAKTKQKRKEYKALLTTMEERRKKLHAEIEQKYKIPYHAVPDDIKEYLLAYLPTNYATKAKEIFDNHLKFTTKELARIKQYREAIRNGIAKPEEKVFKAGKLATWLAEDIVTLLPIRKHTVDGKEHNMKINNDQYRTLQACFAFFSTNKAAIKAYFQELHLISNKQEEAHPFLAKVDLNQCSGILKFYESYLQEKERWAKSILFTIRILQRKPKEIAAKYGQWLPMQYTEGVQHLKNKKYDDLPVFLPRGLFNQAIQQAMQLKSDDNATFAFKKLLKEDTQPFYQYERYVTIWDEAKNKNLVTVGERLKYLASEIERLENIKQKTKLTDDEKYWLKDCKREERKIFDNERLIRYIQSTDRALWLMIKEMVKTRNIGIETWDTLKLADIDEIINREIEMSIEIHGKKIKAKLPIRRYGDLRRIAKDRRLKNLFEFWTEKEVEYDVIVKELECYDERRDKFFELIYNFEKEIYTKFERDFDSTILEDEEYYDHNEYIKIALSKLPSQEEKDYYSGEKTTELRNKFSHSEIPCSTWLKEAVNNNLDKLTVDKIFDVAEKQYKTLLTLI